MRFDGVLLVAFASIWFTIGTLLIKGMGPEVPVYWIAFIRNVVAVPILLYFMRRQRVPIRSKNWFPLILRGVWGTLAMTCSFWALSRMPIPNAMLLRHATPLYAALWGTLFMGEKLDRFAIACIAVAFGGVFLAFRPTSLSFEAAPYLAVLAAGFFSSLAFATIRTLSRSEDPLRIILFFGLVGTAAFLPWMLRTDYLPSWTELGMMTGVALSATAGQVFLTVGIGRTPVSKSSLGVLFIIVGSIFGGWLFFGELPDRSTWLGCLLITGGILGLVADVRRRLLVTVSQ